MPTTDSPDTVPDETGALPAGTPDTLQATPPATDTVPEPALTGGADTEDSPAVPPVPDTLQATPPATDAVPEPAVTAVVEDSPAVPPAPVVPATDLSRLSQCPPAPVPAYLAEIDDVAPAIGKQRLMIVRDEMSIVVDPVIVRQVLALQDAVARLRQVAKLAPHLQAACRQ